jgi:hypothetical protein
MMIIVVASARTDRENTRVQCMNSARTDRENTRVQRMNSARTDRDSDDDNCGGIS